jgi:hypothetical protein
MRHGVALVEERGDTSGLLERFMLELEDKFAVYQREMGDNYTRELDPALGQALGQAMLLETRGGAFGVDYSLELVKRTALVTHEKYPVLFAYVKVSLPGRFSAESLDRENHGCGYHMHYINSDDRRTNLLLTFDPKEAPRTKPPITHTLFCEEHGNGVRTYPERFQRKRRRAIFDTSVGMLNKVPKSEFKEPGGKAGIFLAA